MSVSQQSGFPLTNLAYHAYEGVALRDEEKVRFDADLGSADILILRNHGRLTCRRRVAEAFQAMHLPEADCRIQIHAQAGGCTLLRMPQTILDDMGNQAREISKGLGANPAWPGRLRRLDRRSPGYHA